MSTFNVDQVKQLVVEVGHSFEKPDDDWEPVLFMVVRGQLVLVPIILPEDKAGVKPAIAALFKAARPDFAALLVSCWRVTVDNNSSNAEERMRQVRLWGARTDPEREEMLLLEAGTREGIETWQARIQRFDDQPPRLSEWEPWAVSSSEGRMANILQHAFSEIPPC